MTLDEIVLLTELRIVLRLTSCSRLFLTLSTPLSKFMEHFPQYKAITNGTHGISNGFDVQFSGDSYKEILGKYLEFTRSHLLSIALVYLCVLCVCRKREQWWDYGPQEEFTNHKWIL